LDSNLDFFVYRQSLWTLRFRILWAVLTWNFRLNSSAFIRATRSFAATSLSFFPVLFTVCWSPKLCCSFSFLEKLSLLVRNFVLRSMMLSRIFIQFWRCSGRIKIRIGETFGWPTTLIFTILFYVTFAHFPHHFF